MCVGREGAGSGGENVPRSVMYRVAYFYLQMRAGSCLPSEGLRVAPACAKQAGRHGPCTAALTALLKIRIAE
jgi:hypothetical protein